MHVSEGHLGTDQISESNESQNLQIMKENIQGTFSQGY